MAGTVATVPTVKRAVHHLTASPHSSRPVHRVAAAGPVRTPAAAQPRDCDPGLGGDLPAVPLVTYASPIADEPGTTGGVAAPVGAAPVVGALGLGGGGGGGATVPVVPGTPDAGAVPEPSIWLMMIAGVGALGGAIRRRRRAEAASGGPIGLAGKAGFGGALWSGSVAVEAGDMATTVAMKSVVAGAAGKALLCVCPAAIVAGSVMTVPPLRQAVHAATFATPVAPPAIANATLGALPCTEAPTVPVAATAVDGFPEAVQTVPATASRTAAAPTMTAEADGAASAKL